MYGEKFVNIENIWSNYSERMAEMNCFSAPQKAAGTQSPARYGKKMDGFASVGAIHSHISSCE
jgi:hypothetical protein